jgi:hypothetical protein
MHGSKGRINGIQDMSSADDECMVAMMLSL